MELANIEKLLDKYLEGQSSIADEKILREYFLSNNVASHLEQFTPLFQYFIDAKKETFTKTVPLKPRKKYYKWISVAALVIFCTSMFTYVYENDKQDDEAVYVYYKTKEALQLLSNKFNKGAEKVAYLNGFEQTKNTVFKK